jgi:hypothetical protein
MMNGGGNGESAIGDHGDCFCVGEGAVFENHGFDIG